MSGFWNCSEPPAIPSLKTWCEDEVETACKDLCKNIGISGWLEKDGVSAYVYAGGDWDMGWEGPKALLSDLLRYAVESHVCCLYDPSRSYIPTGDECDRIEASLAEIESVIAEARLWIERGRTKGEGENLVETASENGGNA